MTELQHRTRVRNLWLSKGGKPNTTMNIPKQYKLTVKNEYFVYLAYWNSDKKRWIEIETVDAQDIQ